MKTMDDIYSLKHIYKYFDSNNHCLMTFDGDNLNWWTYLYGIDYKKCIKNFKKWTIKDQSDLIEWLMCEYKNWKKRTYVEDENSDTEDEKSDTEDDSDVTVVDDDFDDDDDDDDDDDNDDDYDHIVVLDDTLLKYIKKLFRNKYNKFEIVKMMNTICVVDNQTTKFLSFLFF